WFALRFGAVAVWSAVAGLIAVGAACLAAGHALFEQRRPALADNIFQAFIGPMFFAAKAVVALGFRQDLAAVLNGQGDGPGPGAPMDLKTQSPPGFSKRS